MQDVEEQKQKLEQKKNRLAAEEVKLKLKERKMRTRNLIELGGLIVKAELNTLPVNTIYGALLFLAETMQNNESIKATWALKGNAAFNKESKSKTSVIIKFEQEPAAEIKSLIREYGLRYNRFRKEWYGYVTDLDSLKAALNKQDLKYTIEL